MGEYDYEAGHHLVGNNEPAQPQETVGFRLNHLMVRIKVFRHLPWLVSSRELILFLCRILRFRSRFIVMCLE